MSLKVKTIYEYLDALSPFELQEKWDNSGLLVGSMENEVEKIYLSLDLDLSLIEGCVENSLIITHHPLIFKPLKNLVPDSFSKKIAVALIKKNISLISIHTNFDKTHLNRYVTKRIFEKEGTCEDFFCRLEVYFSFDEVIEKVKKRVSLSHVNAVKCHDRITSISVTTGSGMSLIDKVDTDLFLTGDIKYHDALEAKTRGISLIDISHYESEIFFAEALFYELKDFRDFVIITNSKNPFQRL